MAGTNIPSERNLVEAATALVSSPITNGIIGLCTPARFQPRSVRRTLAASTTDQRLLTRVFPSGPCNKLIAAVAEADAAGTGAVEKMNERARLISKSIK